MTKKDATSNSMEAPYTPIFEACALGLYTRSSLNPVQLYVGHIMGGAHHTWPESGKRMTTAYGAFFGHSPQKHGTSSPQGPVSGPAHESSVDMVVERLASCASRKRVVGEASDSPQSPNHRQQESVKQRPCAPSSQA